MDSIKTQQPTQCSSIENENDIIERNFPRGLRGGGACFDW